MQLPYEIEEKIDLSGLLRETAIFLWKDWSNDMKVSHIADNLSGFKIYGECPHCSPVQSAFETVTGVFRTQIDEATHLLAVARCVACRKFILAAVSDTIYGWKYAFHYPLGKPNDAVAAEIPEHIRLDFQEAKRCLWVNAFNATVEMCRRAIESTCLALGVPDNTRTLQDMIDTLEEKRIITPALKLTAHKVRLGGDRGAHPPQGIPPEEHKNEEGKPVQRIEEDHARAVLGFTEHFLQHIYVIPGQLDKYDFSRTRANKTK